MESLNHIKDIRQILVIKCSPEFNDVDIPPPLPSQIGPSFSIIWPLYLSSTGVKFVVRIAVASGINVEVPAEEVFSKFSDFSRSIK